MKALFVYILVAANYKKPIYSFVCANDI